MSGSDKQLSEKTGVSGVSGLYGKKLTLRKDEKSALTHSLTQRERDTYRLLMEGYTLRETADQLGIGYSTVNTYQTAIYRKLHVNSRAELIINYYDIDG